MNYIDLRVWGENLKQIAWRLCPTSVNNRCNFGYGGLPIW